MDITTKSKVALDANMMFITEQSLGVSAANAAAANMNELFANLESNIEDY